jgi:hypothetical protein
MKLGLPNRAPLAFAKEGGDDVTKIFTEAVERSGLAGVGVLGARKKIQEGSTVFGQDVLRFEVNGCQT